MINVYAYGIVHLSVCVPAEMTQENIVEEVNKEHPTGISHGWEISSESFKTGEANPHICEKDNLRKHYLMVC